MNNDPIVIVSCSRTALGNFLGCLSSLTAPQLGAATIKSTLSQDNTSDISAENIDEVIMGCVLPAGLGQAPARQAAIYAGIPEKVGATTINKMCGSGMKAIMLAHDMLMANNGNIILAGGMESMSNAPYLLDRARTGYRLGHGKIKDHMFLDGLEDAYDRGKLMGWFADETAKTLKISRNEQDEWALISLQRAQKAQANGSFAQEITPVEITQKKSTLNIEQDEGPLTAKPEKIPHLKPVFQDNGTVTAANASSISDGAASCLLMRRSHAQKCGFTPIATIVDHNSYAQQPSQFTTAPIGAIEGLLKKVNWTSQDVDLFEINEAFAMVTLAAMQALKLPVEKVNIHGGACALGHPIGASGARIIVTLIHALREYNLQRGIACLCIGGGEATAIAVARHPAA